MEISKIETWLVGTNTGSRTGNGHAIDRWLFVEIHTDQGVTGVGEAGSWGFLEPTQRALHRFEEYLKGKDPLRREHLFQYLYRNCHFRGAVLMGALSAIDMALWDIAGKSFGAPISDLLGGSCRTRARAYVHAFGETTSDLVQACKTAVEQDFTAIGHLSPLLDEPRNKPYFESHVGLVERAQERVRRYREAVGPSVDLCIEMHRRLDPEQAIVVANAIDDYTPMFYEDPVRPDNFDAMATVAKNISVPIATGERMHTIQEFEMLLNREAVQYARPAIGLAGGFTGAKKIAGLCESANVKLAPHNPLSPVTTAASLQLVAAVPNFAIQEYPYRPDLGEAPGEPLINETLSCEEGFLSIPDRPGIGVSLNREAISEFEKTYTPRDFATRLHTDGSVVDQ